MKKKPPSSRSLSVRLRSARGRTLSSQLWLTRQLNDPYVKKAKLAGYRSRAAYKLSEIDDKFKILKPGALIVDLGAAPGGWTQVALERVGTKGTVIGIDLTLVEPLAGATLICGDFNDLEVREQLKALVQAPVDVVLSDMAASSTGHPQTDHIRIMMLAEEAFFFAQDTLKEGGTFVSKVLQGGTEKTLLTLLKKHFNKVVHFKPPSSRSDSAEMYVIALGYHP